MNHCKKFYIIDLKKFVFIGNGYAYKINGYGFEIYIYLYKHVLNYFCYYLKLLLTFFDYYIKINKDEVFSKQ